MAIPSQYKSEKGRDKAFASHDSALARWLVPYETRFVETKFGPTHLMTYGPIDAPPLVLIHGHGTNATMWYPIASALASHHRVYAPDTIGDLGKSAGTKLRYDSDDHSRWLRKSKLLITTEARGANPSSLLAHLANRPRPAVLRLPRLRSKHQMVS